MDLTEEILRLKRERNAVILAHNYQRRTVQEVADYVGDSLELSLKALEADADVILFAGVRFMAEQAKILNPEKTVLLPHPSALCTLARMADVEEIKKYRERYPDAPLLVYVNSTAEAKALADYVVTSSSAVEVASKLDADVILFSPDANLASYIAERTGKKVVPIPSYGHCYVHELLRRHDAEFRKRVHPDALLLVHPEAPKETRELADFIGGTGQMVKFVRSSKSRKFIIGTEVGMLNRLTREFPDKEFYPLVSEASCIGMSRIKLRHLYISLRDMIYEVDVPKDVAEKAREAIMRTLRLLGKV